ncbi:MAG: hypothetical protein MH204_09610 [Fimbriimonadaceae bacterium]|nr:hypothetical protein [Fimbriimonadaceae bacterium]
MTKLFSGWVWLVLSIAIAIVVLSWALFYRFLPQQQYAASLDGYAEALQAEAAKLSAAERKLEDAKAAVGEKTAQWQSIVADKTPGPTLATGGVDLSVTPYQLTVDSRRFRNSVQAALNRQIKRGGIEVVGSGPQVPFPSEEPSTILADFYNFPAARFPVAIFELGSVTVRGTYAEISNHMAAWSDMPDYMAVASNLSIQGTAPDLTATYNLVLVAYLRGKTMPPALPGGGAAAAPGPGGVPAGSGPMGGPELGMEGEDR